jgi:hypothetical protein
MTENQVSTLTAFKEWIESPEMQEGLDYLIKPDVKEKLGVLVDLVTLAPPKEKSVDTEGEPRYVPFEVVQLDYTQTGEQIKMLTDIRFRLLAFVPSIVGGGVTLLSSKSASTAGDYLLTGSIGVLGFMLTLGVVLYDLRNSQLYNAHMHRAKVLEKVLKCVSTGKERLWPTPSTGGGKTYWRSGSSEELETGGVHTQRAKALGSILGQRIGHASALSLVYGVALGAWIFPIVRGLGAGFWTTIDGPKLTHGNGAATCVVAFLAAVISAIYFRARINAVDRGSWAEEYEDKIAQEEIKQRRDARRLWRFKVTARDEMLLGIRWRAEIRSRKHCLGIKSTKHTIIVGTNRMLRSIGYGYYSKLKIEKADFLVGYKKAKVIIKEQIPYKHFAFATSRAGITGPDRNTEKCYPINLDLALEIARLIGVDTEACHKYSEVSSYYLCIGGGAIENGSQV